MRQYSEGYVGRTVWSWASATDARARTEATKVERILSNKQKFSGLADEEEGERAK